MTSLVDKLSAIQQPRPAATKVQQGNVISVTPIVTLVEALEQWEEDEVAKAEYMDLLKGSEYPSEIHNELAALCSKFDREDVFLKAILIGKREDNRIFLNGNLPTFERFHLKYYETNNYQDFMEFVVRLVGQKGFADSQRIWLQGRVDFEPLEQLEKKTSKKK